MELDGNKAIVIIWQGCLCLVRVVSLKWDRHAKKQKNVSPSTLKGKMRKAPKNSKELVLAAFLHICSGDADGGVIGEVQLAQFAFLKSSFSFFGSGERCCLKERTCDGETQCVLAFYIQIRPRKVSMKLLQTKAMQDGKSL